MALDKKYEALRARAVRALGENQATDAVAKFKAIIGTQHVPDSEPLAQLAFEKLHNGKTPSADELTALEIVIRLLRPVVFSRNGVLDDLPDKPGHNLYPQQLKDLWSRFRGRVQALVPSIGRVETKEGKHVGTGFLVEDGVIATNRHVLGAMTFGSEVLTSGAARIAFKQETGSAGKPEDTVAIAGVAAIHPKLDMVLLSTARLGRPPLPLSPLAATESTQVVAIGYPGDDPTNNPLFLTAVFQGKFGVKRAALGEVLDGTEAPTLFHDCSTTQGNSGSPVFSLVTGLVAGIHRGGFFMYRNDCVDANALRSFVQTARG